MGSVKLEYIWLDGYKPEPNLRSKTKIISSEKFDGTVESLPWWSFDGSSTQQAEGSKSDCLLKPVRLYKDADRKDAYFVLTEVYSSDHTPHPTNHRATIADGNEDFWFGYEQEYTFVVDGLPMGFPERGYPKPQGEFYCAVGTENVSGRAIVEEHLDLCLEAGLGITGINAEVMLGQWEYQVFGKGPKAASDDAWMARYLLFRTAEKYGVEVEFAPKPVKGDWNGSGMHTNFSNTAIREQGGEDLFKKICDGIGKYHAEHIAIYGSKNDERLTGLHETQHIGQFSYGVSDRGASIRIPIQAVEDGWKGYLEDRRPASNADPYQVAAKIVDSVNKAMA